jgi:predicted RNA-binding Zn-ribbon protein involved in translation (DUF1610 family)
MIGVGKNETVKSTSSKIPDDEPKVLPYFVRDDFFSDAEASFYRVLKNMAADHLIICPKVSLAEIFYVSHPNESMTYFNRINRKHVDYLLCDTNTLRPRFAIELDDSSHQRSDRMERDDFVDEVFSTTGLPLVRVPVQLAYNTCELAEIFRMALQKNGKSEGKKQENEAWSAEAPAPFCPKCGQQMVLRTAQRGSNAGKQFYGCPNYPRCKIVISLSNEL